jgi:hypothetical protein
MSIPSFRVVNDYSRVVRHVIMPVPLSWGPGDQESCREWPVVASQILHPASRGNDGLAGKREQRHLGKGKPL